MVSVVGWPPHPITDKHEVHKLVGGRPLSAGCKWVYWCTAPTKNVAAPISNLQNIKDKHADQKRDP